MKKFILLFNFLISSLSFSSTDYQEIILTKINTERAKYNLKPMILNESISNLAIIKSNDMAKNNYFSHISKKYGSPFDMLKKENIKYFGAGENIAKGQKNEDEVMKSWLESKGHRKNILNPNFTEVGIGKDTYSKNIWTQIFIGRRQQNEKKSIN